MPPKLARHDDYAEHRCACKHIVYPDDTPGGDCRFCPCEYHVSEARPAPPLGAEGTRP